jgi:hypothetical protein
MHKTGKPFAAESYPQRQITIIRIFSDQRPRVGALAPWGREPAGPDKRPGPPGHRGHLVRVEQLAQAGGERAAGRPGGQRLQVGQDRRLQPVAGQVPEHGAQLGLDVEAEPVVDRPDMAVKAGQAVVTTSKAAIRAMLGSPSASSSNAVTSGSAST